MINSFMNIWVIGTNYEQFENYEETLYKCKFITNAPLMKNNINHLNRFLSEYVCMWYVWKNNIKSEYIAFCHYRRQKNIQDMIFPQLQKGYIQYFYALFLPPCFFRRKGELTFMLRNIYMPSFIKEDAIQYLKTQTIIPYDNIKKFCTPRSEIIFPCREIFACKWEIFCDMMEFISGYVEFICNKYNLVTKEDWINHIKTKIISYHKSKGKKFLEYYQDGSMEVIYQKKENYLKIYDKDEGLNSLCNNWRMYSYMIEDLIGLYIGTHKRVRFEDLDTGYVE